MLNEQIKKYIDSSILCWLATVSSDGIPNVSPKEIFTYFGDDEIIIANIASPQTVKNIQQNDKICISFIDVLVQKGYQLKGVAKIITEADPMYKERETELLKMTGGKFPFKSITSISIQKSKPILAPSYMFYPDETTEEVQIANAKRAYGI